jgi:hypothetical protein
MGRSFDRGGQSRKERERGKRRSYRQAERNREALEAVAQAKFKADLVPRVKAPRIAAEAAITPRMPGTPPANRPVAILEQKRPGFIASFFGRIFKKSA